MGGFPQVVRDAIASGERERLARKAMREALKAGAGGAIGAPGALTGAAPYGGLHGEL